jgi:hypothetical protein
MGNCVKHGKAESEAGAMASYQKRGLLTSASPARLGSCLRKSSGNFATLAAIRRRAFLIQPFCDNNHRRILPNRLAEAKGHLNPKSIRGMSGNPRAPPILTDLVRLISFEIEAAVRQILREERRKKGAYHL